MDVSGQKRKLDLGGASALSAAPGGMHINPYTGRPFSAFHPCSEAGAAVLRFGAATGSAIIYTIPHICPKTVEFAKV